MRNLAGLKVVRAFPREPREGARFSHSADDLVAQELKVAQAFSFLFPIIFLASNFGQPVGERGTHDELRRASAFYYNLYMSQFRRDLEFAAVTTSDG